MQRIAWIRAANRPDINNKNIINYRICSEHFASGKKCENSADTMHPDWAPTVKLDNFGKFRHTFDVSRHNRYIKRNTANKNASAGFKSQAVSNCRKAPRRNSPDKNLTGTPANIIIESEPIEPSTEPIEQDTNAEHSSTNLADTDGVEMARPTELIRAKHKYTSTEMGMDAIEIMETVLLDNTSVIFDLKQTIKELTFDISSMDDAQCKYYTGLPTKKHFMIILKYVGSFFPTILMTLTPSQLLLLTLIKLRLGSDFRDLGYRFNISEHTASRNFYTILNILYGKLKSLISFPDKEQMEKTMPASFRKYFGKKVSLIIDCTEIFIETPSNPKSAAEVFSHYKNHSTIKYLIGITPHGIIAFISPAYGGRASDGFITKDSGLLSHIEPGTIVLADKGFKMKDSFTMRGAELQLPAFVYKQQQLNPIELEKTRHLANVRIHVERVIGLLKNKYRILQNTFPCNIVFKSGVGYVDQIMIVCCALLNICPSIVPLNEK